MSPGYGGVHAGWSRGVSTDIHSRRVGETPCAALLTTGASDEATIRRGGVVTQEQLEAVMLYQLEAFNTSGEIVNRETVHDTVLKTNDGFGNSVSSAAIYKSFVRFSIVQGGETDRKWPKTWLELTVSALAARLLGGQA
jgi:hypothetical protein